MPSSEFRAACQKLRVALDMLEGATTEAGISAGVERFLQGSIALHNSFDPPVPR
jgi:hypothetical protein